MVRTPPLRSALALSVCMAALAGGTAAAQTPPPASSANSVATLGELVVTAQRRSEALQDVPAAVSAFSEENLKMQRLETGSDLLKAIPNVNFSRGNFGGYNFSIRGIGTKLVATGADAAIGVHVNNVPLGAATLGDSNFLDIERVEVLRGPQGTQFGRNTTGGLVNIITAKPKDLFEAEAAGEIGNYDNRRLSGMVNVPLGDMFAVRLAGQLFKRDGFGENLTTGEDIDGRDMWSTRATLAFHPTDKIRSYLMWEHFKEDDNRTQVGKQLCIKDLGRTSVGGVPTTGLGGSTQNYFSQGCAVGDLRGSAGLGTVNSAATLGGGIGNITGLITGDAYAGKVQDGDLRSIESALDPVYKNRSDAVIFNVEVDLTDTLTLSYTGSYSEGKFFNQNDYNRTEPSTTFNPTVFAPGGFFDDPQVGRSNKFRTFQVGLSDGEARSHELRLQSNFGGPFEFSLGATRQKGKTTTDLYVLSNTLTAAAIGTNLAAGCPALGGRAGCVAIDQNPVPDGSGGNYFDSRTDYRITSTAGFGEVSYKLTDDLKATVGLRYTRDKKFAQPYSPGLLVPNNQGTIPLPYTQKATFGEWTGRFNVEWSPQLEFTNQTLVYASYARGYKGGGFNPPQSPGQELFPKTYDPEFINAFEVGTKNTLLDGRMILNATGFYYDYKGYQVSQIIQRTSVNSNIDAEVWGIELESLWEPVSKLRFNASIGWLQTRLKDIGVIDLTNLTQNDPNFVTLKNGANFSNCIAPTADVAKLQGLINAGILPAATMLGVCGDAFAPGTPTAAALGFSIKSSGGIPDQLGGNELPNSPEWTVSLGAQYTWELGGGWEATPRVDFYYQAKSFSRIYNQINDRIDSWTNTNVSLLVAKPDWDLSLQFFIRNLTDETAITDQYLTDDSSGLFTNIFLSEPRTYGVSVTKRF